MAEALTLVWAEHKGGWHCFHRPPHLPEGNDGRLVGRLVWYGYWQPIDGMRLLDDTYEDLEEAKRALEDVLRVRLVNDSHARRHFEAD